MHRLEHFCVSLRHSAQLGQADWLWDHLRDPYNKVMGWYGRKGLARTINGTDPLRVLPEYRGVTESYEPDVWKHLMSQVQPADIIADVGAYIGLYSVTLATRVGNSGKVVAFEPDPTNFAALESHCRINAVLPRVTLINAAVGDNDGTVLFHVGRQSESRVGVGFGDESHLVPSVRLDTIFQTGHLDILKIDVEGYEELVLKGGRILLEDERRKPRLMYIEVHPYAWPQVGSTSGSLLDLLSSFNYQVFDLHGVRIKEIRSYGEILAYHNSTARRRPE